MTLTPIETRYKGCRFRSRLEARWAVFFDTIGLEWTYEPEGFELGNGLRYLPDFYIKKWNTWVEVKPTFPSQAEMEKFQILCENVDHLGDRVDHRKKHSLICGTPAKPKVTLCVEEPFISPGDGYFILSYAGFRIKNDPHITIDCFAYTQGGTNLDIWPIYIQDDWLPLPATVYPEKVTGNCAVRALTLHHGIEKRLYMGKGIDYYPLKLAKAYQAARSARFEFEC